jgi:hypothetical protein
VPKLEERMALVVQMHEDLRHFGEQRTLAEICYRYFWHNRLKDVKTIVRMCQHCQMVKRVGNMCSEDEEMKTYLFVNFLQGCSGYYATITRNQVKEQIHPCCY